MNKKKPYSWQKRFHAVPFWVLVVALIGSLLITIGALRNNNIKMVQLREAVYEADKNGGDVETALAALRAHVHAHMNTSLTTENGIKPPIQLRGRYERLVLAEQERVKAANDEVYIEATATCERQFPQGQLRDGRVQCVEQYVEQRSVKPNPIPQDQYKFDFFSPGWSPDLAGWGIVISAVLALVVVVRVVADKWLRHRLAENL